MRLELREAGPHAGEAPLLLVHGSRQAAWCFAPLMTALAERGVSSFAPSLRGHGESPGREQLAHTQLDDYVEDVRHVIEHVGRDLVLVGHSMGGAVAQKLARHPHVLAIVLLASVPPDGLQAADDAWLERTPLALEWLRAPSGPPPSGLFFSKHMPNPRVWFDRLELESPLVIAQLRSAQVEPREIHRPIRVVGASDDALLPRAAVERSAAAYSVAPHWIDAGHNLMLEPQALAPLVNLLVDVHREVS